MAATFRNEWLRLNGIDGRDLLGYFRPEYALNDHVQRIGRLVPELRTVTSHDLRRGHATIMAENRVPADVERQIRMRQIQHT